MADRVRKSVRNERAAVSDRLRILVLGYIVRGPVGGLAWHHLQYVMGLTKLGHHVHFLEDSDDYPSCYDPEKSEPTVDPTYGIAFTRRVFDRLGLGDRWAYHDAHRDRWVGPCADRALGLFATADVLINLSAINPLRSWAMDVEARALVDTDPVFTQIRHLTEPDALENALKHTAFFTFGENFGSRDCRMPDDGLPWQPTRQPVVLDAWPVTLCPPDGKFTTVMQWKSYQVHTHNGRQFGMKEQSFKEFKDLPSKVGPLLELVVSGGPRERLLRDGWLLRDPIETTADPWRYQEFIRASKAEFGIAKHGYVTSNSGWFSERSAAYLASGRPVLAQNTGFTRWLPTGRGLLSFDDMDDAIRGIDEIQSDYDRHAEAAREIIRNYFDSRKVLTQLLERSQTVAEALP
jgi:hypothetical protein